MGIRFYCGINETKWNHHPVSPGPFSCVSPVYGKTERTYKKNSIRVPNNTSVLQDSGAFSDGPAHRLEFAEAYDRQVSHAEQYKYSGNIILRASYDLLIDEKWERGKRYKKRWSEVEAVEAVSETVSAAEHLKKLTSEPVVLSAQGVSVPQYLECARQILALTEERDVFGLGGWCIIGRMRTLLPTFYKIVSGVIPMVAVAGISSVHIWGVIHAPALGPLLWLCDQHDISLSTDSAGPTWRPAFGHWGYADWVDRTYQRPPVETRGLERARHVGTVRQWLSDFANTQYYGPPTIMEGET